MKKIQSWSELQVKFWKPWAEFSVLYTDTHIKDCLVMERTRKLWAVLGIFRVGGIYFWYHFNAICARLNNIITLDFWLLLVKLFGSEMHTGHRKLR